MSLPYGFKSWPAVVRVSILLWMNWVLLTPKSTHVRRAEKRYGRSMVGDTLRRKKCQNVSWRDAGVKCEKMDTRTACTAVRKNNFTMSVRCHNNLLRYTPLQRPPLSTNRN